ncbi:MAG TPA: hypothetical protein VGN49_11590 [Micrococcaceae bacterium]|nr:hypothetical protein [Micrococcaceae bacterium]
MSEYYPFRQFLMPEICPSLLTHRLVPSISTGQPNGNISYGTVLAEMEQAMADDGTGGVGQLA